jgi:membrane protease YdiL (CAAX protease family)
MEDKVEIVGIDDLAMAETLRIALKSEGIESSVEGTESTLSQINVSELGRIKIRVDKQDYEKAIQIARLVSAGPAIPVGEVVAEGHSRAVSLEVLSVLLIAVFPVIYSFLLGMIWPVQSSTHKGFVAIQMVSLGQSVFAAIPVLFILALNEKRLGRVFVFNIRMISIPQGVLVGILVYAFFFLTRTPAREASANGFLPNPAAFLDSYGLVGLFLTAMVSFALSFSEELVFRAYLITRAGKKTLMAAGAILFSSVLYAFYYATGASPTTFLVFFVAGLLFSAFYVMFKNIWPVVIGHALVVFLNLIR